MSKAVKHPSGLKNFKRSFSQNGIHIYEVSKRQARQVMKEFPEFYLDARGSKQPIILGLE